MESIQNVVNSKQPNILLLQVYLLHFRIKPPMKSREHMSPSLPNPEMLLNEGAVAVVSSLATFLTLPVFLLSNERLLNTESVYLIKLFFLLHSFILIIAGYSDQSLLTKGLGTSPCLNILNMF